MLIFTWAILRACAHLCRWTFPNLTTRAGSHSMANALRSRCTKKDPVPAVAGAGTQ